MAQGAPTICGAFSADRPQPVRRQRWNNREHERREGATDGLAAHRPTRYFAFMRNDELDELGDDLAALKAIASPVRLTVLALLKDPVGNFPSQVDGDLISDGVCADFIRERLGIASATASRHLSLLTDCGLLVATRKKGWTFYRRDESAVCALASRLAARL